MKILLVVLGCSVLSMGHLSHASSGVAESVSKLWSDQHNADWRLRKGRCWKKDRGKTTKEARNILFEIDLVDWLLTKPRGSQESHYEVVFRQSRDGLKRKMKRFGYSTSSQSATRKYWSGLEFSHPTKSPIIFEVVAPLALRNYRLELQEKFSEKLQSALNECVASGRAPTRSLAFLVYLALRDMSPRGRGNVLLATLRSWSAADEEGAQSIARYWLGAFANQMSILPHKDRLGVFKAVSSSQKDRMIVQLTRLMEAASTRASHPPDKRLRIAWIYHSAMKNLEIIDPDTLAKNTSDPGNDPVIYLTIADTARLLHLAEDLAREGDLKRSANIVQRLLMLELGTEATGLRMRRPIRNTGDLATPYPLWLALVPAYQQLSLQMSRQDNQLTAEQYKIARNLSRDQYVSGVVEAGLWSNFEQVLNR